MSITLKGAARWGSFNSGLEGLGINYLPYTTLLYHGNFKYD